jgi:trimeric autotransporter adhesin
MHKQLDYFGESVSINSDATYVIISAYQEDGGAGDPAGNAGAAYVFSRSGSTWSQQANIKSI